MPLSLTLLPRVRVGYEISSKGEHEGGAVEHH